MKIKLPNHKVHYIPDKDWKAGWAFVKQQTPHGDEFKKLKRAETNENSSFVYLPRPDEPNKKEWQLVQHVKDKDQKTKKYLKHPAKYNKISSPDPLNETVILASHAEKSVSPPLSSPETRVKFLITKDKKVSIYKTVIRSSVDAATIIATITKLKDKGLVPLLLDVSSVPTKKAEETKIIQQMKYGTPLINIIKKSSLSSLRMMHIAEQCCHKLQSFHDEGFLLNDLKPENIVYSESGEIDFIDYDEISEKPTNSQASAKRKAATPGFCRKKVDGSYEDSSEASDIYALGRVFSTIIQRSKLKNLNGLSCLSALMATNEAQDALSSEQIIQWFNLSRQSHLLINSIAAYYPYSSCQNETDVQKSKRSSISAFLDFSKKQDLQGPLDTWSLDAIGYLFRYFPHLSTQTNWEKLLHPDTGAVLACVIIGVGKDLDSSRSPKNKIETLKTSVADLLNSSNTAEPLSTNIQTIIDKSKQIKKPGKELKVLEKDTSQSIAKAKFLLAFPNADESLKIAYNEFLNNLDSHDTLKKSIIFTGLKYLESPAGKHGKRAVRRMICNLVCPIPHNTITNQDTTSDKPAKDKLSEEEIHKAVEACCAGGFFSSKSAEHKLGSRAQIFNAVLNTNTPQRTR
jgi:serine/threonine protein kinase